MTKHALLLATCTMLSACGGKSNGTTGATLYFLDTTDAEMGKQGLVRINFDNPVPNDTDVTLTSTYPSIAKVPAKATVPKGQVSTIISYDGVATGSTAIFAVLGSAVVESGVSVVDKARVIEIQAPDAVEKGGASNSFVHLNMTTPTPVTVTLASSSGGVASAPPKVTIPPWSGTQPFEIDAASVGVTTFTATLGDSDASKAVAVVAKATLVLTQSSLLPMEAGATVAFGVSTDANVAKSTPVTVTSSDKSVATADAATIAADSTSTQTKIHALAAGTTTLSFSLEGVTTTLPITVIDKASPTQIFADNMVANQNGTGSVILDATVAKATAVMLSMSDPTVATVPSQAVVEANNDVGTFTVTALSPGVTTLTATVNGVSIQHSIVVSGGGVLQVSPTSQFVVVGATVSAYVSGNGTAMVTTSDPTVLAVPPTAPAGNYFTTRALAPGSATITATVGATSASSPAITVVDKAALSMSTDQVAVNATAFEYLRTSAVEPAGKMVTFTSSNPAVIAAPAPVAFLNDGADVAFPITGLASGTAVITATIDGVSASEPFYVGAETVPPAFLIDANISSGCVEAGGALALSLGFTGPLTSAGTITLSASPAGVVSLPPSVVVGQGSQSAQVAVGAVAAGSANISITSGNIVRTVPVTVVSKATLTLNLAPAAAVGQGLSGYVTSSCALAGTVTLSLASTDATVLSVAPASITLAPFESTSTTYFSATALKAGMATVSATPPAGYTAPAMVAVTVN